MCLKLFYFWAKTVQSLPESFEAVAKLFSDERRLGILYVKLDGKGTWNALNRPIGECSCSKSLVWGDDFGKQLMPDEETTKAYLDREGKQSKPGGKKEAENMEK